MKVKIFMDESITIFRKTQNYNFLKSVRVIKRWRELPSI